MFCGLQHFVGAMIQQVILYPGQYTANQSGKCCIQSGPHTGTHILEDLLQCSNIEIGNINTKASAEAIRKLKSILDQHAIFHIIDGVIFFPPQENAARMQEFHRGRARECKRAKDDFHRQYRELIVPDLYELNFMSLIYFDSEEAEFLATLVYGEN